MRPNTGGMCGVPFANIWTAIAFRKVAWICDNPYRGHSANLTKYLLGKMTSNAELGGADHLARQKLAGLDFSSRARMADRSKRRIIMNGHAFHPKYCDALALFPWWRASLSIKNNLGAHGGRDHSRNSI